MPEIKAVFIDMERLGAKHLDPYLALASRPKVAVKFFALVDAICEEWPRFAGGGYFEAMHGSMSGYFEIRLRLASTNFRFICKPVELDQQFLVVIAFMAKPIRTGFRPKQYQEVLHLFQTALALEKLPLR